MKILTAYLVRASLVLLLVAYGPVLRAQTTSQGGPAVNPDSVLVMDFEKQIKEYVKLHKKAEVGIPALKSTASAHKINEHRRLLASHIQAARPQAKQGDIFSPEITQEFKRLISMGYQGADAAKVRASLRNDEPVNDVRVRVNGVYPEHIPLQTMPPSILLNLQIFRASSTIESWAAPCCCGTWAQTSSLITYRGGGLFRRRRWGWFA